MSSVDIRDDDEMVIGTSRYRLRSIKTIDHVRPDNATHRHRATLTLTVSRLAANSIIRTVAGSYACLPLSEVIAETQPSESLQIPIRVFETLVADPDNHRYVELFLESIGVSP